MQNGLTELKYRPLYFVPSSQCLNCQGGRLVPNIPFINDNGLTKIQRNFGNYPRVIKEALKASLDLPKNTALCMDGMLHLL